MQTHIGNLYVPDTGMLNGFISAGEAQRVAETIAIAIKLAIAQAPLLIGDELVLVVFDRERRASRTAALLHSHPCTALS